MSLKVSSGGLQKHLIFLANKSFPDDPRRESNMVSSVDDEAPGEFAEIDDHDTQESSGTIS
jgi:hypothetical protein